MKSSVNESACEESGSYTCEDCDIYFGMHFYLWLDNKSWAMIGGNPDTRLCGSCILDRLSKRGILFGRLALGENNFGKLK